MSNGLILVQYLDPLLRGFAEQFVDNHLQESQTQNMKGIVNIFRLGIKSKTDAEIGFFLGYSYAELMMQFLIMRDRLPDKEETTEFFNILKRRFPEIIQQVKKIKKSEIMDRDEGVLDVSEVDVEPFKSIVE